MLFTKTINQNKSFLFLYKRGQTIPSRDIIVYYKKTGNAFNSLGITVSKKVGNAVVRNRAKRIILAAYAKTESLFPIGYDIVIVARASITKDKSYHIEKILRDFVIKKMTKVV